MAFYVSNTKLMIVCACMRVCVCFSVSISDIQHTTILLCDSCISFRQGWRRKNCHVTLNLFMDSIVLSPLLGGQWRGATHGRQV